MQIILVGINGKMGQILNNIANKNGHKIIAGIDVKNSGKNIYTNFNLPQKILKNSDIVVDFARSEALEEEIEFCKNNNLKLIICSTGHSKKQLNLIKNASKKIPIFLAPNTSLGVAIISKILNDNLRLLKQYDISIIEKHHSQKVDSPSGTAKAFLKDLKPLNKKIDCVSLRHGTVFGEHQILLFGQGEQIEIKHVAQSRELFALGTLRIVEFMKNICHAGLYTMQDILLCS